MPALFDVVIVLSVLSLVFAMGRWSVNLKWNKPANAPAGPPPKDSEMAVTEFEVIEGLSPFGLPEATLTALRQRIKTVEQLKHAVETIRTDSCRHAQEQMLPLAQAYVKEANITEHADDMVQTIIFGQLAVSSGAAHPAFASIAGQLGAIGPELWHALEKNVTEQLNSTQVDASIEPTNDGMVRVVRMASQSSSGFCEFDPSRTEAERQFWVHVAVTNIDSYVNVNHGVNNRCHGDLLTWSKFMAALEAKKPAESIVTSTAAEAVVEVEQEVLVALDNKSAH